jgi:hypothetical protein
MRATRFPWNTNGKHCNDRYKLLLAKFRRVNRARALASGTEEEFGERDQLLADIQSAVNDNEERGRTEREESAKRDERLATAGKEVRANAMSRKHGARSDAKSGNADEDGDDAERLTTSHDDKDMTTPTNSRRGRKKHSTSELEEVLAVTQEKRSEHKQMRLKLKTERLNFEKERAEAHDRNEEKRLDVMAAQADLQRQQKCENTRMQLKMFQVMEEKMKKIDH